MAWSDVVDRFPFCPFRSSPFRQITKAATEVAQQNLSSSNFLQQASRATPQGWDFATFKPRWIMKPDGEGMELKDGEGMELILGAWSDFGVCYMIFHLHLFISYEPPKKLHWFIDRFIA